jgi:hypothetical protein
MLAERLTENSPCDSQFLSVLLTSSKIRPRFSFYPADRQDFPISNDCLQFRPPHIPSTNGDERLVGACVLKLNLWCIAAMKRPFGPAVMRDRAKTHRR